ncbi:MAG: response regulator [Myxococcota bacterium]
MKKVNVLVVCEDPTLRKVYSKQIRILGADVRSARSADEALAQTHHLAFDRVICGENLGDVSGAEALRRISLVNEDAERVLLSDEPSEWAHRTIPAPFDFETLKTLVACPADAGRTLSVDERLEAVERARLRRKRRVSRAA